MLSQPSRQMRIAWTAGATILLFIVCVFIRLEDGANAWTFSQEDFFFETELLGLGMQRMFIPLIGLFFLSSRGPFQRVVTPETAQPNDGRWVMWGLGVILFLELMATVWLNEDIDISVTNGLAIVLFCSLIGGWRWGLGSSLATVVFYTVSAYFAERPFDDFAHMGELIVLTIFEISLLVMVWGSVILGLWRPVPIYQLKPQHWFLIGAAFEWLSALLTFFVHGTGFSMIDEIPGTIITGLVMMLFGFLVQQANGRTAEKRLVAAEGAQSQAELKALRAQINPHFLFNALSTIKYHARTSPETAYDLLDDLSDVFHTALRSEPFVTLEEELDTVKAYLAIEQARLRERLTVKFDIDEAVDLNMQVPALVLQPLVENSVIHGIALKASGGTITIRANQNGAVSEIEIEDDGIGFDTNNPQPKGSGIGLSNSSERLAALYGSEFAPQIESSVGKGTLVTVKIPLNQKH
ncbi:MAG: histidine kinase [Chloroflexota bacterium]